MQILLIEPDIRLRDIFNLNLTQALNAEVITKATAKEAWEMAEILGDLKLIISKDKTAEEESINFLVQKLDASSTLNIPLISLGLDVDKSSPLLTILPENTGAELLSKTASTLVNKFRSDKEERAQEEADKNQDEKYCPVPLNIFHYFASFSFDVFIRLKRGENFQYLKRIKKDDGYDLSMIEGYKAKGVEYLFIEKKYHALFTENTNKRFTELLNSINTSSKSKEEIQKYVLEQLTTMGFTSFNLELAQGSVTKINSKIEKSGSKVELLNEVYNSQLGYHYRRSYMISIVGSLIIKNIDWGESKFNEYITMAAYLHDMFLESDDEMRITTENQLEQAFLNLERSRVENHAYFAAERIRSDHTIPEAVEKIVRQHHGVNTGKGYSSNLEPTIKKLSIVFMVSEDFAMAILDSPRGKINGTSLFKEITQKYNSHKDVLKTLDSLKMGLRNS